MALNPETGTWRRIAGAPQAVPTQVVVWTGKEAIFADAESLLRYSPSTNTWSSATPDPRCGPRPTHGCLDRAELVVWGGSMIVGHGRSDYDMSLRDGYAYRPATDHWRLLPAAPIGAWGAVGLGMDTACWCGAARPPATKAASASSRTKALPTIRSPTPGVGYRRRQSPELTVGI